MSLHHDVYDEVDELIGRLWAIRVNWPDTEVRVKHSIFNLKELLSEPTQERMVHIVDDLQDLRVYLQDILKMDEKELSRDFRPTLELVDRLLGPINSLTD